jgi:hypothetical protein
MNHNYFEGLSFDFNGSLPPYFSFHILQLTTMQRLSDNGKGEDQLGMVSASPYDARLFFGANQGVHRFTAFSARQVEAVMHSVVRPALEASLSFLDYDSQQFLLIEAN